MFYSWCHFLFLFTSQFSVKAAQADSESLECRQRIPVIHGEHILANLTKLKNDLVMIRLSRLWWCWCTSSRLCCGNKLEILDRGNCHSPTEIQAPTLQLFVPSWCLVSENKWSLLSLFIFFSRTNNVRKTWTAKLSWIVNWFRKGNAPKRVFKAAWEELRLAWDRTTWLKGQRRDWVHGAVHPPWTPGAKHIQLICNLSNVIAACRDLWRNFLWAEPAASTRWCKLSIVV